MLGGPKESHFLFYFPFVTTVHVMLLMSGMSGTRVGSFFFLFPFYIFTTNSNCLTSNPHVLCAK